MSRIAQTLIGDMVTFNGTIEQNLVRLATIGTIPTASIVPNGTDKNGVMSLFDDSNPNALNPLSATFSANKKGTRKNAKLVVSSPGVIELPMNATLESPVFVEISIRSDARVPYEDRKTALMAALSILGISEILHDFLNGTRPF